LLFVWLYIVILAESKDLRMHNMSSPSHYRRVTNTNPKFCHVTIFFHVLIILFLAMPVTAKITASIHNVTSQTLNAQIFGGTPAKEGEFPFMALTHLYGSAYCGATIISSSRVLSAAHCFVGPVDELSTDYEMIAPPSDYTVSVGTIQNTTEHPVRVRQVLIPKAYNFHLNTYDLALLELEKPLTFNKTVRPARIATNKVKFGDELIALGWGMTETLESSSTLQYVRVKVESASKCRALNLEWTGHNYDWICTGDTPGRGVCYGDSGGPLVLPTFPDKNENFSAYLLGVTSFDNMYFTEILDCAANDTLDYFTRVIRHIDWITAETGLDRSDLLASSAVSLPRKLDDTSCLSILLWFLAVFIVFGN
jgi:secreted trypsin-like serine protease